MILNFLCAPALTYLILSIINIITDLYTGIDVTLLIITSLIMTILLQILCMRGLKVIAWLLVFIPIIMYVYTTIIIFSVFGTNPNERIKHYLIN